MGAEDVGLATEQDTPTRCAGAPSRGRVVSTDVLARPDGGGLDVRFR